jgi:hypothetical protein
VVESVETQSLEDVAMREIIEGRLTYVLGDRVVPDEIAGLKKTLPHWRDESDPPALADDFHDSSPDPVQSVPASAIGAVRKEPQSIPVVGTFLTRRRIEVARLVFKTLPAR